MSVAYFVLCHSSRPFLLDLFRHLYSEENLYVLHCDQKAPADLHDLASGLSASFRNVEKLPSRLCSWGGFSLVSATLDAMGYALIAQHRWDHFVILSESHLPLMSPDEITKQLQLGVSYIETWPVEKFPESGKSDIRHRFTLRYRELPGVGSFGGGRQALPVQWPDKLYHGSQWMVLSRVACEGALESISHTRDWEVFEHSLLADETALQTLVMNLPGAGRGDVQFSNRTFVAAPHLSGSNDIIFSVDNFFSARDLGHLFIRKRPKELADLVQAELDTFSRFSREELEGRLQANAPPRTVHRPLERVSLAGLLDAVRAEAAQHYRNLKQEFIEPRPNCPTCYVKFSLPHWGQALSVVLLSQDLATFKMLLLLETASDGLYQESLVAGYLTTVLKLRVYGLFLRKEIHVGASAQHGFLTPDVDGEAPAAAAIARILTSYLNAGNEVAGELLHAPIQPQTGTNDRMANPPVSVLAAPTPKHRASMYHIVDPKRPDLGGNLRHGDIHTSCPVLWRFLIDRFGIKSFLDIGCGEGHAVLFFHRRGVHSHGIDGLELNIRHAVAPICQHDLLSGPYIMPVDLTWSCEVAEHIDESKVDYFIRTLTNGRVVAMTHAVPGQGGYHHVNCQSSDYWIDQLEQRGYCLAADNAIFREVASKEHTWNYFMKTGLVFVRE
ncbi:MAG: beta-1,6-N-acetylglucosaminyltransferase [Acetobacteraceae bacterium]